MLVKLWWNLYILRGFEKLVIIICTSKDTPNLIDLLLFLKHKKLGQNHKSTKIKNKKPSPSFVKLPHAHNQNYLIFYIYIYIYTLRKFLFKKKNTKKESHCMHETHMMRRKY